MGGGGEAGADEDGLVESRLDDGAAETIFVDELEAALDGSDPFRDGLGAGGVVVEGGGGVEISESVGVVVFFFVEGGDGQDEGDLLFAGAEEGREGRGCGFVVAGGFDGSGLRWCVFV